MVYLTYQYNTGDSTVGAPWIGKNNATSVISKLAEQLESSYTSEMMSGNWTVIPGTVGYIKMKKVMAEKDPDTGKPIEYTRILRTVSEPPEIARGYFTDVYDFIRLQKGADAYAGSDIYSLLTPSGSIEVVKKVKNL